VSVCLFVTVSVCLCDMVCLCVTVYDDTVCLCDNVSDEMPVSKQVYGE